MKRDARLVALGLVAGAFPVVLPSASCAADYPSRPIAATPAHIVNRLHAQCLKVLAMPDVREALKREGLEPSGGTPQEFARYIRDENALWAKVIADAGIKPE